MKRIVATMLLTGLCLTSLCGCAGKTKTADAAEPVGESERSISAVLSYDDYAYTEYGSVEQIEILEGCDYYIIAIQPLDVGGEPYEDYPWNTAFIPKELAEPLFIDEDSSMYKTHQWVEDEDGKSHLVTTCYRFKLSNCDNGGGFISMPVLVLEIEEIDAEDIPVWGGA